MYSCLLFIFSHSGLHEGRHYALASHFFRMRYSSHVKKIHFLCNDDDRLGGGGTSQYIAMKTMLMEVMKMNKDAKGVTLVVGADRVVRGICRASFL